ncbi:MAG: DRTGG domain-containing protein [Chloroflexota bacterium]|jgi:predicted transcriptional regulator|uniref:DRTGG domain-containing protein n=1 Tax=Bellilinea sp. TaxID=2838785 RepID=UPI002ADD3BAE|nr:DRTGG domain-containing protein [Bellilinea sp.]
MKLNEIVQKLNGKVLHSKINLDAEVKGAGGADLMSDVLASIQPQAILLTGLCNPQVVRTAMMADVLAIVLVRGKTPPVETVQLAEKEHIPLISTPFGMFEACGILYQAGLSCLERPVSDQDCFAS